MKTTTETIGLDGVEFRVRIIPGMKRRYSEIVKAANDEGTIQAWDAERILAKPIHHHTMSLGYALRLAGFKLEEI